MSVVSAALADHSDRSDHEDASAIAVVGIACRLPGASGPGEFWRLLSSGAHAVTSVPADRWVRPAGTENSSALEHGAFLDRPDLFDADFFGISPREAAAMDPQQRLMLEIGWEALEDAGLNASGPADGRTGVFVGAIGDDYATLLRQRGPASVTHHTLTGLNRGMIANRLSYLLGARGPSMVIDTGQSSSLVAVHAACQSLRNGECETALAGGLHLNLAFDSTLSAARFGGLSPDGRCFVFDSRANGFVRGEGGGLVLLKPLSRALADGDRIHGVLRGSAVNNDGGGDTLTTPSGAAQEDVLRRACAAAGVGPADVQYVELHGTGTAVGDPIEAAALAKTVGAAHAGERPLLVGSAKTNVGHLEGAAGITGLIKVLLSLKARQLPPSLNFRTANPAIPLDEWNLRVQTELSPWPRPDVPLVAGVSAFGVGGTNAHVIVSEAPSSVAASADDASPGADPTRTSDALPWVVSARTTEGLRGQAARLRDFVAAGGDVAGAGAGAGAGGAGEVSCTDIGWSLAEHRTALEHRAAVVGGDREELLAGLDAIASGEPAGHVITGTAASGGAALGGAAPGRTDAGVVFVFPGQGSQWLGMAAELLNSSQVFAAAVEECAQALAPYVDWDLRDVLRDTTDGSALRKPDVLQPTLWAVMVSLSRVWRSLGVVPAAVIGHSQGEIAAACVAGALSLDDAARLVALRSQIAGKLTDRGGMASLDASAERAAEFLAGRDDVWIAAVNGPGATVVAGDKEALGEVLARAESAGHRTRIVENAYASHTPHVEPIRDEFLRRVAPITPRNTDVPMYSTVTAGPVEGDFLDADYWYSNLRRQVRFRDAVQALVDEGRTLFLEVSAHPVLTNALQESARAAGATVTATGTLRRDKGDSRQLLTSLTHLWVNGADGVDWTAVFHGTGAHRTDLPTYAFQRSRHWFDTSGTSGTYDTSVPVAVPAPAETPAAPTAATSNADTARQVRAHAAAVLGHATADGLDANRTFKDLGFDSIMLGDLRNRLTAALGVGLTTATLFDHPTPAGLARHIVTATTADDDARTAHPEDTGPVTTDATDEPIAIIAMSCRLPGGTHSPEDLWRLVAAGQDAISDFPEDRGWDLERLHGSEGPGSSFTRGGGFLDEAGEFDARFFGISPREALAMDPQQRLLLETSWELLERAGIDPASLRDSRTGVFVGTMDQEYGPRLHEAPESLDGYLLTGKTTSVASGRIAYLLGLTGPALTVDTACSSSLVALHLAVQSLRRGESSLALAGGVTVLNTPGIFTEFSRQRGLSSDGRCKAFAAAADGTGMAEGAGMLLVERLSDAERNGHRVLAVIRGSAVNQDGASNGLTAPSGLSQQRVIRDALADAGVAASGVDVVEAHGTGTALGDPIEAQALLATYGQERPSDHGPVLLGSVKSNIGHTQAAAGVAGVIKMVMALREGVVPRTLHVDEPSPQVDWSSGAVELATRSVSWPESDRARRAAVSSFGISGTNAHVILEQARPDAASPSPAPAASPVVRAGGGVVPWVLSGRSVQGLRGQAARLREFAADSDASVAEVGWSLAMRRAALEHRAVVVAGDREEFLAGLDAIASGEPVGHVVSGAVPGDGASDEGVVFVFPGQGSQWAGMAVELLDAEPVFAASVDRCAGALAPYVDWSLTGVLRSAPGAPSLERVDVVQPVLWAVMVSLAEVWRSVGVVPSAVVGHSQGELAAACVAGVLSLEDGARIVALRSRLIGGELSGLGGMVSVARPVGEVSELLVPWGERISVAAVNGPGATVVAGDAAALDELMEACAREGVQARRVPVDYASHSPHVEAVRDRLMEVAAPVVAGAGQVPVYSTVTGGLVAGEELDAEYWYRNLREQVRFQETVEALVAEGHTTFVEVSAHPVLTGAIEEAGHAADKSLTVTGTLRRGQGGAGQFFTSLAALWVHGVAPDWSTVLPAPSGDPVDLPTYAFQHQRYWLAPTGSATEVRVDLPSEAESEPGLPEGFSRRVAEAATAVQQKQIVLSEVCRQAAAVLGWSAADEVEVGRAFRDLGFDSLSGVELRNRLVAATGLTLSPTAVFDHPTPVALAAYLRDGILGVDTADSDSASGTSGAADDEPIAIVATGCRFPGGVRSPEDLWDVLLAGHDVISEFPTGRGWDFDELYHPDTTRPGSCYVHQGGFLHDAGEFDAGFFGISPREAVAMDPQQRLLLETSWESLERAGIDPLSLRGSRTGVFVGVVPQGYGSGATDTKGSEGYLFTGSAGSVASGRIAYSLGLNGPAITVDTACSSSLVALHLAVRSLRNGECGMALVGGVSVMSTSGIFTEFSHQRGLAPDGRCKPFAAAADGTAWAEGVGMLLVERLSDARRNGHQVLAVIRGSAVNQDGASNGLTAPNGPAQERVIRDALADAGVAASGVDVVEAHGTGTALGDPIEAQALLATYGRDRAAEQPVLLGSVKSNIGHTQAAAGVAGVIKMVLALRAGVVPGTLHVDEPSPHVDWSAGAVELVTRSVSWPESDRARRAAVSSFGVSGTNAHVIVEAAPVAETAPAAEGESGPALLHSGGSAVPWLVSGRSAEGLRGQAARLREFAADSDASVAEVGWSLAMRRAALEHRAVVVAGDREEFLAGLDAIASGEPVGHVVSGAVPGGGASDAGVVFVFPGQGSQWAGMARELLESSPVFAARLAECGTALEPFVDGWSLLDVVRQEDDELLRRVDVVQPVLWAVMVSLAEVWRSVGVVPSAVVGHSQG
uniref:type I polyketide synthase n=1 Tax=Streptomyces atriruber TaxID=545121 RepID=UPI000AFBF360